MLKHPFLLVFVFFSVVGILVLTKQIETPKIFLPKANVIGVSLSMVPSKIDLDKGGVASFDISLDPDEEQISAIELSFVFDETKLDITDITPSDQLPQTLAKDVSTPGRAKIIFLSTPGNNVIPAGVVGRVYIKGIGGGRSTIKFGTETKVSALGKTGDVLGAIQGAEIMVNDKNIPQADVTNIVPERDLAAEVINQYLETPVATPVPESKKNLLEDTSEYIQTIIKSINKELEEQAKKWL